MKEKEEKKRDEEKKKEREDIQAGVASCGRAGRTNELQKRRNE